MNSFFNLTSGRLDALDISLTIENARNLDTKVDVHRFIPARRVVIEE
jgi:hypothetical protein